MDARRNPHPPPARSRYSTPCVRGAPMTHTPGARTSWLIPTTPPPGSHQRSDPLPRPVSPIEPIKADHRTQRRQRPVRPEERLPTPHQLQIQRWCDPIVTNTVPANGFYTERYYAPIVGPTCLLLLRALASRLETDRDGFVVDTAELAARIGCSSKAGSNSQFWKALRRGVRFGLLRQVDERVLVRTEISPLTSRMVQRLPLTLRREHRVWTQSSGPSPTPLSDAAPTEPVAGIQLLRLAARGLCTPEELRTLDRAHKLS